MTVRAVLSVAIAIFGLSAIGRGDMFKPSPAQQVELGKRAADDLRKKEKVLPSTDPRVRLVRRIGQKLIKTFKDDKPWQFSFDVIESKQVNAFALPGGPTFIYTGLLDKLKTEDELAGVMGHELTHVRREHWAYAYRDSQQHQLGLTVLLMVLRANSNVANIASISDDLVFNLPFSRKHESEADTGGLHMMIEAGFNPQGIVDAFKLLADLAGKGAPPEILSDHPSDTKRIKSMQSQIDAMHKTFPSATPLRLDGGSSYSASLGPDVGTIDPSYTKSIETNCRYLTVFQQSSTHIEFDA